MIWEALTKLALLGTERGRLPEEVSLALEKVGIDANAAPEQQLLDAAALYHQLRRAGFPLLDAPEVHTTAPSVDQGQPVPARAARQLQQILQGKYGGALPEYLRLASRGKWQIPSEQWPVLFSMAVKNPSFWDRLQPLLGPRSHWLLRQNPAWHKLAELPPEDNFADALMVEKQMMVRYLRRRTPGEALPLLQTVWEGLSAPDKKRMLEELETGLSDPDLPFLEEAWSDRRKEVRQEAARLMALLPSSPVQTQLFKAARQLLSLDKNGRLQLDYPEDLSKKLKRLGVGRRSKQDYAGGKPATWAFEIVSKIPPKQWEAHFKRPTLDTIRLFLRGNQQRLLTEAVANASIMHQDHRWIEAIIRHWRRTDNEQYWKSPLGKTLIKALPEAVFNDMLESQLGQQTDYIEESSFANQMLCLGAHDWSPGLSKKVIFGLQERLKGAQSYHWNLWHYKRILKVAAFRCAPSLLADFRLGWDKRAPIWEQWAPDVDRLLRALAFRESLYKTLSR